MPSLPSPGESYAQAPEGTHVAICCAVIHLGTQHEEYQGNPRDVEQIMIRWELANETMDDGRPFEVMRTYTWSTHAKSALRKDLEAWRGVAFKDSDFGPGGFDIKNIIGKPCFVMVGRTEGGKAKVTGVGALPKGMNKPKLYAEPHYLWLSAEEFEEVAFDALSDFWKDKIKTSPQYKALFAPVPKGASTNGAVKHTADLDDEIPF